MLIAPKGDLSISSRNSKGGVLDGVPSFVRLWVPASSVVIFAAGTSSASATGLKRWILHMNSILKFQGYEGNIGDNTHTFFGATSEVLLHLLSSLLDEAQLLALYTLPPSS
jgi:hypothetical protein